MAAPAKAAANNKRSDKEAIHCELRGTNNAPTAQIKETAERVLERYISA
jgi:hypothetical protein